MPKKPSVAKIPSPKCIGPSLAKSLALVKKVAENPQPKERLTQRINHNDQIAFHSS